MLPFFVCLSRRVGAKRKAITATKQGAMADISSLVQESLSVSGILLGKSMGRSAELADRFEGESARLADLEVRSRMAGRWTMASIQTSFAVMPALVYLFAGLSPSAVSIGTVVAFTTLQTRLFWPISSLLNVAVDVQTSTALFDRVFEYLDLRGRHPPGDSRARLARGRTALRGRVVPLRRGRLDAAGHLAGGARGHAHRDRRRDRVGEDDAGLPRRAAVRPRPRAACVIDGIDIRELTFSSLADVVGVVSQETYLFHASVRENLRFARPDATDEEIEDAARAAQIHDTIAGLPDGYDTVVGERGFRFSGGEKQRIAIARTVLRNPPVLVLDEATSALDVQTERAVEQALVRLAEGRTTIVIAHRLSTVRGADQIVVLDQRRDRRARHARGAARPRRELRGDGGARRRRARGARRPPPSKTPPRHSRRRVTRGRQRGGRPARDLAGTGPKAASPPGDDPSRAADRRVLDVGPGRSVDHHGRRAEHDHAAVRGLVAHAGGGHAADHHLRRAHDDRVRAGRRRCTCRPRAAAGMPAISTVGQPGGRIGPPTCGTTAR